MADAEVPDSFQHLPSDVEVLTFEGFEAALSPVGYRHASEGTFFWDVAYVFDELAAAGDTEKGTKHLDRMQEMCNNESSLSRMDLHCRGSDCRRAGSLCTLQSQDTFIQPSSPTLTWRQVGYGQCELCVYPASPLFLEGCCGQSRDEFQVCLGLGENQKISDAKSCTYLRSWICWHHDHNAERGVPNSDCQWGSSWLSSFSHFHSSVSCHFLATHVD